MDPVTPRRIAVVGAESTGKTTLCAKLADDLQGLWIPEYLRRFCDERQRTPFANEQAGILQTQIELEDEAMRDARAASLRWVIADSAPITTAICSAIYFNDASLFASATAHHSMYEMTLITALDLAWEPDGIQRDGPAVAADFHARLLDWLGQHSFSWALVSGAGPQRLASARKAIAQLQ